MKNTLEFYGNIYEPLALKGYGKKSNKAPAALKIFKEFSIKNNIKIKSAIDVGCRWGKTLKYWRNKNIEIVGVDVSETMVKYCNEEGYNCYLASATNLSIFKNNQFDLYIATDVYEHLKTEDLIDAVKEAKRITKKYLLIKPHPLIDRRKRLHLTIWGMHKWKIFFKKHNLKFVKLGPERNKIFYKQVFLMEIK